MTDLVKPFNYRQDLLENKDVPPSSNSGRVDETNELLRQILKNLNRRRPRVRAVIDVQDLIGNGAFATVRFLNQGKPVKSLYTIISNASGTSLYLTINEPPQLANANGFSGIYLNSPFSATNSNSALILENVEIEYLNITTNISKNIGVNKILSDGAIWVYAWTDPEDAW